MTHTLILSALLNALPGIAPYSDGLQARLQARFNELGPDYQPRTEHWLDNGQPQFVNRLLLEDSPYLLQHAHNPVDWYPWGEEAFAKARAENKPIFLSIGYATCHWCHVMEKESFDNPDMARLLNEHFVCIKVDRERRPAVDSLYMTAVVLRTGQGGWPMSSFLTPAGKPFFNGTYYPPDTFAALLQRVQQAWSERRADLEAQAEDISQAVAKAMRAQTHTAKVGSEAVDAAVKAILKHYDSMQGGFGTVQKFPQEPWLMLLLNQAQRQGDETLLDVVRTTLDAMLAGGIHDQVGGGFHRYTVDPGWLTPHFEKMLYNQAQLARVYLRGYRFTGEPLYARAVRTTLDYVLRDMRSPEGAFYSATDADSAPEPGAEAEEGRFFLWTRAELKAVLTPEEAQLAIELFEVSRIANFEGSNILHLPVPLPNYARQQQMSLAELLDKLDTLRAKLYRARQQRPPPLRDDKIITAWNGMLITALAEAGLELDEPRYLAAARQAAEFLWQRGGEERLWRIHLHGKDSIPANLEDYAYLTEALLALYDTALPGGEEKTANPWLARAEILTARMLAQFWDKQHNGFFLSGAEDALLMLRPKDGADDAIPSANAVALRVLTLLALRTGKPEYEQKARALLQAFAGNISAQPHGFGYMLAATDEWLHGEQGVVRYAARGAVKVRVKVAKQAVQVTIHIREGWHLNAHQPLEADLIATTLKGPLRRVDYPPAVTRRLGFRGREMALYEDSVTLSAQTTDRGRMELSLQACSDKVCLPPERLEWQL